MGQRGSTLALAVFVSSFSGVSEGHHGGRQGRGGAELAAEGVRQGKVSLGSLRREGGRGRAALDSMMKKKVSSPNTGKRVLVSCHRQPRLQFCLINKVTTLY